jgi:hypothetical protein
MVLRIRSRCFARCGRQLELVVLAALLLFSPRLFAIGQAESNGTIIVVSSLRDEVIFAADSREYSLLSYSDDNCKIVALGNKAVFAAAGREGIGNPVTAHIDGWNAFSIASNVYRRVTLKNTPQRLSEQLARSWGAAMKEHFQAHFSRYGFAKIMGEEDAERVLTRGAFANFEKDGSHLFVVEKITYEIGEGGKVVVSAAIDYTEVSPSFVYSMGTNDIVKEIDAAKTFRAVQWRKGLDVGMLQGDSAIFASGQLVQLTIENYPATLKDAEGKPFSIVGGKVAIGKLTVNGFEWVQPAHCSGK